MAQVHGAAPWFLTLHTRVKVGRGGPIRQLMISPYYLYAVIGSIFMARKTGMRQAALATSALNAVMIELLAGKMANSVCWSAVHGERVPVLDQLL